MVEPNDGQCALKPLPDSVRHLALEGRDIYLVGTAHISKKSVREVRETIEAVRPEAVCVELCAGRYRMLQDPTAWKNMDIVEVIRTGKASLLLTQLIMASFYRQIGEQLGVQPGAEMLAAAQTAKDIGAELFLADRDIQVTLKRVWAGLGLRQKARLVTQLLTGLLFAAKIDEETIDNLQKQDQVQDVMDAFAGMFPEVKKILIDERDVYLSQKIREVKYGKIVAVVGAGHVAGILREIHRETPLDPISTVPPRSLSRKILPWAIPIAIMALLVYGFIRGGTQHSIESLLIWVLVNGILAALGAAIALGHPLTILSAFVAAPITSLNPFIAAGWVSGLVQAFIHRPKVADLENLPQAISSFKGFWKNPVSRILLVVAFSNIGSSLGTFISGGWIASRVL